MSKVEQRLWWEAWKKWVDMMHSSGVNVDGETLKDSFNDLWYPKEPSQKLMNWKEIVQIAFTEGYEAGFTDRIFNGERHENL